jgi:hypothetical protein
MVERIGDEALYEEMLALPYLSDDWKDRACVLRDRWLTARQTQEVRGAL